MYVYFVHSAIAHFPQEPDDDLHNPDPHRDRRADNHLEFSKRGLYNVGCLAVLLCGLLALLSVDPFSESSADRNLVPVTPCSPSSYKTRFQHWARTTLAASTQAVRFPNFPVTEASTHARLLLTHY